jgi:hypothetical protein
LKTRSRGTLCALLAGAALLPGMSAFALTMTHTAPADFAAGNGDGHVSFTAVVDGEVALQKQAGTLSAFSSVTVLPFAMAQISAFTSDTHLYLAGMADASDSPHNNVYSAPINGGVLGAFTALGNLPITVKDAGVARWRDHVYIVGGAITGCCTYTPTNQVFSAKILPGGNLSAWSAVSPLPIPCSGSRVVGAAGYLFEMTLPNGIHSAPILADGSLGAWSSITSTPSDSQNAAFAYADGYVFLAGGDPTTTPFSTKTYSALVNGNGTLGPWVLQAAGLPAARTWYTTAESDGGGKHFELGGRTGLFGPWASTQVFSTSFTGGGTVATWITETTGALPAARAAGTVVLVPGALWYLGGVNTTPLQQNSIYASTFASGPANAHQGRYVNGFDVGSLAALNSLSWNSNNPSYVSARARTADTSMVFGAWSAYSSISPLALGVTGRYVEYEFVLADPGSGSDLLLEDVSLDYSPPTPTPTATPSVSPTHSPTATATPSSTPSPSPTGTASFSPTPTASPTASLSGTISPTPTISPTFTETPVLTATPVAAAGVQLFPNPFHPDRGESFHLGNVAPGLRVSIYNIIGEPVISFTSKGSPAQDRWDGLNANGVQVVTGIYFLNMGGKTYRIAVVRR